MSRILIVAAHPDDEILGCGATILKRIQAGDEVASLVLGEGVTSRYNRRGEAPPEELAALRKANEQVAAYCGFVKHWLLDFPDNRFDSVDFLDLVKAVEHVKREVQPDIIYTHFEHDLNLDHRLTFQAVLTACRPKPGETLREIYSFETPSSSEWVSPFSGDNVFRPNVFVNVKETLERKIEAMRFYDSELAPYPHPRSPEALRTIAKRWGVACGQPAAEAFILIRKIG
ncbi:MAG TPA: PIG-L family deacetylase [Oculatellaceae cyanobacterium]|jgi:LmbE family N-acetylglucosaminyl deacetylase